LNYVYDEMQLQIFTFVG